MPALPIPIVALDVPGARDAMALVDRLAESCRFYKVGSELFATEGPAVVRDLQRRGCDVFLDLKFHDIPNTVRGAVRSAAGIGAALVTVHASGGLAMLEAAVEGASAGGEGCGVLAVTVLTSLDAPALGSGWGRDDVDIATEVLRLAGLARRAGAHGVVCAGTEAAAVRAQHGTALAVLVPGIRLEGGTRDDQARVVTPAAAVAAGARYLVLGRVVTAAADPLVAMQQVATALQRPA